MVQLLTTLDIEKKKKKQMDYYYYTTKNSNLFEFSFYRLNYNLLWMEGLADYQVSFYWVEP